MQGLPGLSRVGGVDRVFGAFGWVQFVVEQYGVRRRERVVNIAVVTDWTATFEVGVGCVTGVKFLRGYVCRSVCAEAR